MSAANDLLSNYQHVIESLTFVTGSKGVFDVEVDGEMIFSKHAVNRHAEPGEVLHLFEQNYAANVERYGT